MNSKIQRIIDHMNSNLQEKVTVIDFTRLAKLSRSRTYELFRAETGISPGQYVNSLRMQKAAELLETTSLTLKQIRAKVGMRDKSTFLRAFKQAHHLTPSEYRTRSRLRLAGDRKK